MPCQPERTEREVMDDTEKVKIILEFEIDETMDSPKTLFYDFMQELSGCTNYPDFDTLKMTVISKDGKVTIGNE